ncbi:common central domain of tyrosinase-domain-containing protein [Trichophaea hybrida]|nr:common central domain of tyrosinase-domain-containing protein [Trichophaea hybrida]
MSDPTYAITGIPLPDPSEPIPVRQEISAWYSNIDNAIQVSLFIQALTVLEKMDFQDKLSYFGVAGIHGEPPVQWDGAPGNGSYCNHNMVTFPTWHRPYVLLFEQRLYEIMLDIINTTVPDSEKELWKSAAQHWRLPYWDWAAEQPYIKDFGVPELTTLEKVDIILPNGKTTVDNPLWKFTNPNGKPMGDISMGKYAIAADGDLPWDQCIATSKYGILKADPTKSWIYGVQNWKDSNDAMQHPQWYDGNPGSIRDAVYRLFTPGYFSSYEAFASTVYHQTTPGSDYMSLEYVHNNIHNFTGGYDIDNLGAGHMSDPLVASFDPIFWLHHCNVDRQMAIWQTLNPDKWFDQPLSGDPQPTDVLQPFHIDTKGTTYNSNMIRDWKALGYQYDTLMPPLHVLDATGQLDRDSYLSHLKRHLNERYSNKEKDRPGNIDGHKNDYIINIIYDRYALNGKAYTIHFFLGDADGEVVPLSKHHNHIGSVYTFSSRLEINGNDIPGCDNCKKQKSRGTLSTAQVPLTNVLLRHAKDQARKGLETLLPDHVETYLAKNLKWKVTEVSKSGILLSSTCTAKLKVGE